MFWTGIGGEISRNRWIYWEKIFQRRPISID